MNRTFGLAGQCIENANPSWPDEQDGNQRPGGRAVPAQNVGNNEGEGDVPLSTEASRSPCWVDAHLHYGGNNRANEKMLSRFLLRHAA